MHMVHSVHTYSGGPRRSAGKHRAGVLDPPPTGGQTLFKHALPRPLAGSDGDRPWPVLPGDPEPKRWTVILDGKRSSGGGR